MADPSDRLKLAREQAGYASVADAARALGTSRFTYGQHENGIRGMKREAAMRYARFFRVSLEWLLTGKGQPGGRSTVPVVGMVGAGAEIHPFDDHLPGNGLEMVEGPPGEEGCVAVRVSGTSQYPMLLDGWLLFYRKDADGVMEQDIGKLCIVAVKDGPMLVKTLRRGTRKGRWRLESFNAEPREDVALLWASRVLDIRPT